jgi:uncharacterized protein (DUF58 family)
MADDYLQYLQPQVVSRLANMELRARLVVEGFITGMHRSPYHGFSVEFAEHRQYMPGDEIRHIDWKIYGRTDRYHVKRYEEETNLKAYLLLDTSASMGFSSPGQITKLDYAASLSASLAYMMIEQRDAVGLALFADGVRHYLPPHSTRAYLRALLVGLQETRPAGTTGAGKALHQLTERIKRRGLVIVLSDLLDNPDEVITALKHFRHQKNEVIVMQILDPVELSFALGDDAVFEDVETRERIHTQPRQIQRAYREAMGKFIGRYRSVCREHGIDYVLMDTSTTFDVALIEYLGKRARLQ